LRNEELRERIKKLIADYKELKKLYESKRVKEWYRYKGTMQLFKNEKLIREFKFNDAYKKKKYFKNMA